MNRCPNCGNWVYYLWVHYVECIKSSKERQIYDEVRRAALKGAKT